MVRTLSIVLLLLGTLVGVPLALATSPWYVLSPGGTYEIEPRLKIPDERKREMGRLAFTAVYAIEANYAQALAAKVSRTSELVPAEQVRPPGASQQQVNEVNRRQIDESKPVAAAVALRAAGYEITITGKGAEVSGTVAGLPAEGVLQRGDVIVSVDGNPVQTTTELIEAVRRHAVGDRVRLGVQRDGQTSEFEIGTVNSPSEPGRPAVGIYIGTVDFSVNLPFPVEVDTDTVGGPSAGLMMALGVLDGVTDGLLTRGYFVAGTGTINVDGAVGPVGGAAEKIVAAERDGAEVFLVPRDNLADISKRVTKARVFPVATFDDAVKALCALPPKPGAASDVVPPPCQ